MRWLILTVVVVSAVLGDLLQSREMKRAGAGAARAPGMARVLGLIVTRWRLVLSILCMAVSFFAFLALVRTEPLSFAVPASAASFALETVLAKFVLGEHLAARRAAGAILVCGGIVLVAR
jgi:drug/metabolite transporter (DMT)-like permease